MPRVTLPRKYATEGNSKSPALHVVTGVLDLGPLIRDAENILQGADQDQAAARGRVRARC